jgi:hypothetical protein
MLGLGIDIRKRSGGLYVGGGGGGGGDVAYKNTHALEVDGVDQSMRWNHGNDPIGAALATTADEGTISFWVYFDNLTGTKYIMEKGTSSSNYFRVFHSGTNLTIMGYSSGTLSVFQNYTSVISPATFHMITITLDATGGTFITTLHLDGVKLIPDSSFPTSSSTIDPGSPARLFMGRSFSSTAYSQQITDEVAVWDTVLSDDAITEIYTHHTLDQDEGNYTNSADLVRWWQLNETAVDATGNGDAITLFNSPSYTETVPFL